MDTSVIIGLIHSEKALRFLFSNLYYDFVNFQKKALMKKKEPSKLRTLRRLVKKAGGMVVAFSGGLDSALLAAVAAQELGNRALAVTAISPTYPMAEQMAAQRLAALLGIRHVKIRSNELKIPGFVENPVNRCYYCKQELFKKLTALAQRKGLPVVTDGTNVDDRGDYRPGRRAAREWGVVSPLLDAGLRKNDIRRFSRYMGLPTADKPSFACLASRFPYGSRITADKLRAVNRMEEMIRALGIRQVRVRHHGDVGRIEVEPQDIGKLCRPSIRRKLAQAAKRAGFLYLALDLQGYRTGSLNESLLLKSKK
jgi:uncharacterized protein